MQGRFYKENERLNYTKAGVSFAVGEKATDWPPI